MPDKIRVALFSSEYPPHIFGGMGTHVVQVTSSLADSVTFEMFVPKRGDYQDLHPAIRMHEVPVPRAQTNVEFWLRFCRNAVLAARQTMPSVDLIHCHDWMTVLAGLGMREALKVPLIANVHLPQTSVPTLHMENLGLVGADLILVNSQAVREELVARGLAIHRMSVVPNGVALTEFCPSPDWPLDDGYILFVGRLAPQKGVDLLLRAFEVVLRRCPEGRLFIVGDGDLELYFQRVTHYLGFPHRVSFVNWQTGPALVELYQKAQFVVMPSYYEPFGIVALEAMACGRPIVASHVGGLKEIIQDGVQGYLTPSGDHLQLARRMADLMLHPERRLRMGQAGRERAAQFSWGKVGETTMSLYQSMVGQAISPDPGQILDLRQEFLTSLEPRLQAIAVSLFNGATRHGKVVSADTNTQKREELSV